VAGRCRCRAAWAHGRGGACGPARWTACRRWRGVVRGGRRADERRTAWRCDARATAMAERRGGDDGSAATAAVARKILAACRRPVSS
jgi:hypothetical protein